MVTCHHDNIIKQGGAVTWDIIVICYSEAVIKKVNQKTGAIYRFVLKALSIVRVFHGNMVYFFHIIAGEMEAWRHSKSKRANHLKSQQVFHGDMSP